MENIMNIVFDIETLPSDDPEIFNEFRAEADKEKATIKAPANYKDEAKIAEYIAGKHAEIDAGVADKIAKTSFSGMYGRIACISWSVDGGEPLASESTDSERQAIERFYDAVVHAAKRERHGGEYSLDVSFVGHNIAAFDLPFLKHRSIILGIAPPPIIRKAFSAKPWDSIIQDTMLMWSSDPHKRGSMDRLCKAFGISGKGDFDGSMVAETWPSDPQKVIDYCKDDVRRTWEMYKRITFQFDKTHRIGTQSICADSA